MQYSFWPVDTTKAPTLGLLKIKSNVEDVKRWDVSAKMSQENEKVNQRKQWRDSEVWWKRIDVYSLKMLSPLTVFKGATRMFSLCRIYTVNILWQCVLCVGCVFSSCTLQQCVWFFFLLFFLRSPSSSQEDFCHRMSQFLTRSRNLAVIPAPWTPRGWIKIDMTHISCHSVSSCVTHVTTPDSRLSSPPPRVHIYRSLMYIPPPPFAAIISFLFFNVIEVILISLTTKRAVKVTKRYPNSFPPCATWRHCGVWHSVHHLFMEATCISHVLHCQTAMAWCFHVEIRFNVWDHLQKISLL